MFPLLWLRFEYFLLPSNILAVVTSYNYVIYIYIYIYISIYIYIYIYIHMT